MQNPPKITFRNMEPSDAFDGYVLRRIGEIESSSTASSAVMSPSRPRKRGSFQDAPLKFMSLCAFRTRYHRDAARGTKQRAAENVNLPIHEAFSAARRLLLARKKQMVGY
ncbi:hypothetical protein [Mesorhizobium xinjiangense]|uniref:hypothetical protein n=1 Tax=Mesorhizobium xinjiangense TaxID=2678685 RepID=UPI0012EE3CC1|nr:hypothetical protein [Mesorhizobium xinjiangense]